MDPPIARGWGPAWLRLVFAAVGAAYLALLAVANTGLGVTDRLPGVPRYFTQVACLFPRASPLEIEYRVEGWSCSDGGWRELDYRRDFPMHSEDKESRFQRLGQFYRHEHRVMHALEDYLLAAAGARGDRLGGIRFFSLRIPIPAPGETVERYRWRPLSDYPEDDRKEWYHTPVEVRRQRCM